MYQQDPRMDKQMDYAVDNRIPFVIFLGENEVKENKIKLKVYNILLTLVSSERYGAYDVEKYLP